MNKHAKQIILLMMLVTAKINADDDEENYRIPAPIPSYQEECGGACHIAFPPKMLPANSWEQIMKSLEQHFGSNATLDSDIGKGIALWLKANASHKAKTPPENRITRTKWFIHEHREISDNIWQRSAIRTAANCSACHINAAHGQFEEDGIHIPHN